MPTETSFCFISTSGQASSYEMSTKAYILFLNIRQFHRVDEVFWKSKLWGSV